MTSFEAGLPRSYIKKESSDGKYPSYPFVRSIFDQMMQTAVHMLQDAPKTRMTQVVVLLTSNGKEYSAIIEDALSEDKIAERALIKEMRKDNDTELRYVMAVWKTSSGVDMPSYDFRKMLCCMNPENKNAAIFMNEIANYTVLPLGATMPNLDFLNEEDDTF